jgi:hypothetical protein
MIADWSPQELPNPEGWSQLELRCVVEGPTRMEAFTFALSTQVDLPVSIKV